jgi:hypothetical protein
MIINHVHQFPRMVMRYDGVKGGNPGEGGGLTWAGSPELRVTV